MVGDTQGTRIRVLFENAEGGVAIIAPFIKVDALRSLLGIIPVSSHLRWRLPLAPARNSRRRIRPRDSGSAGGAWQLQSFSCRPAARQALYRR